MTHTVTLELSDDLLERYAQGAAAARKSLELFLIERLADPPIPIAGDLPSPLDNELAELDWLSDDALWQIARQRLPQASQERYDALLTMNSDGTISESERQELRQFGQKARKLTLKRAHAYMILTWRGHDVPLPDENHPM